MRFYIGIGKRIKLKTIIQFLGFAFVALCAFFGIDKITAHAATFTSNGYSVQAYRCDTYDTNEGIDYCAPEVNHTLYNATGCNNRTIDNNTYCMFQNSNSTSYFSTFNYRTSGSSFGAQSGYNSNTGYRPHSRLIWNWSQNSFTNLCPNSSTITLTFHAILETNNSLMGSNVWTVGSKLCADNLNSVTGSIGSCEMYVIANNRRYTANQFSYGNRTGNYNVTLSYPISTSVQFEVPKIQPFLPTLASEGGTWSNATFNYGLRISAYTCGSTSTSDNTAVVTAIDGMYNGLINNDNNNTNSINQHIDDAATEIVDSIDGLNESINDDSIPSNVPTDDFISSNENNTIQNLAMYPVNLINKVLDSIGSGSGGGSSFACSPLTLDLSSITQRWGGFDYTLQLPCFTYKAKELIGEYWFNIFDLLIAAMLFYYFALHLVERFELFTDGVDMFPGFFTNHVKQQYVDSRTGEVIYK